MARTRRTCEPYTFLLAAGELDAIEKGALPGEHIGKSAAILRRYRNGGSFSHLDESQHADMRAAVARAEDILGESLGDDHVQILSGLISDLGSDLSQDPVVLRRSRALCSALSHFWPL